MSGHSLQIPFELVGRRGTVAVTCAPSDDPVSIGNGEEDHGFPVCSATVTIDANGYLAFCGWVQLVRSTDNESAGREFELDPLSPFADSPSPFCFFGLAPTLFDAPSRLRREELAWEAHSFLAVLDMVDDRRSVQPLTGFEWGFDLSRDGSISLRPLARITPAHWNAHLALLGQTYPTWSFVEPDTFDN